MKEQVEKALEKIRPALQRDGGDVELVEVNTSEGAAYGAALLAGVGAGFYPDVTTACQSTIKIPSSTAPGMQARIYQELYPIYQNLYPQLKNQFAAIGEFVNQ